MAIRSFETTFPQIHHTAYIDPAAEVIGDVTIGEHSSVWPMVVIRGDVHKITIGNRTSIQDGSVLHVTHDGKFYPGGYALEIGNNITVGHKAMLHGCKIHDDCLIGMGAIVMDGAVVHSKVVLGAGSVVPPNRELESGFLWVGSPARKIRQLTEEEMQFFEYSAQSYVDLKDKYLVGQHR